jgi:hypothetical protein
MSTLGLGPWAMHFHKHRNSRLRSSLPAVKPTLAAPNRYEGTSFKKLVEGQPARFDLRIRAWLPGLPGQCVIGSLLLLAQAHAFDPNRQISQYGHTAWRWRDGVVLQAPESRRPQAVIFKAGARAYPLTRERVNLMRALTGYSFGFGPSTDPFHPSLLGGRAALLGVTMGAP